MALVLQDPGMRANTGEANIATQIQGYGTQANENRQVNGQNTLNYVKGEAERRGVTMKYLMDTDPSIGQAVRGATIGMAQNQQQADQMYSMFGTMEADPWQLSNEKMYDEVKKFADLDLLDQEITRTVNETIRERIQTGSKAFTSDDIAKIKDQVTEDSIWTPILGAAGFTAEDTDEGPVWSPEAKAMMDKISGHYLQDADGKPLKWADIRKTPLEKDLLKAIQGQPEAIVAMSPGEAQALRAKDYQGGGLSAGGQVTGTLEQKAMNLNKKQTDIYTNIKRNANSNGAPIEMDKFGSEFQGIVVYPDDYTGPLIPNTTPFEEAFGGAIESAQTTGQPQGVGTGAVFANSGTGSGVQEVAPASTNEPTTFSSVPQFEERERQVQREITETTPGFMSTLNNLTSDVREQGGLDAEKTKAAGLAIEAAQTDIEYKKALTQQAYAQLTASPGMDDITKKVYTDAIETYNNKLEKQDVQEIASLTGDARESHNAQMIGERDRLSQMGIDVELIPIKDLKWWRGEKPKDTIYTLGPITLTSLNGVGQGQTVDSAFARLGK